jgi:DNA polymerase III epsilon subunit-like protein
MKMNYLRKLFTQNILGGSLMKTLSFLTLLSLLITSCSFFSTQRYPAGEELVQTQDEVLQVFEFHSSNVINTGKDYRKSIQEYIKTTNYFRGTYGTGNEIAVEFVEDATLPKGVAYFPEFQVSDNAYKITVLHSKEAATDAVASAELFNFIINLKDEKYFMSHFSAFEMYYNAIEQDPISTQNWAKIREASASMDNYNEADADFALTNVKDALKTRGTEWSKEKNDYLEMAQKKLKLQKKQDLERRSVIEALDKAADDHQFKNLVAKNDRAGVADLLKKYLPWEQMAPFEKRYWQTYLDTIVNPLPMEKRVLIYRGVDDDFIYSAYKGGKELEKETAQKEGKVFVMSTIITKNQGTWNRRLRSLTAMNEKFIGTNTKLESEFTKSARIVTMFVNHSKNPQGSPFLSFTPKFGVAQNFGSHKMSAYALDPRLLSFNFASKFKNEVEFLLPLMAFPEDVVGFFDDKIHTDKVNTEELMKNLFKEKLVKAHGEQKGEELFQKVLTNSKEYFDSALNRYDGKMTAAAAPKEPSLFGKFFDKISLKK